MKNIAYKVSQGIKRLPDGFIIEWIETDQNSLEGYTVVDKINFDSLLANNNILLNNFITSEKKKEINDFNIVQQQKYQQYLQNLQNQVSESDATLFNQFLIWKQTHDGYTL